MEFFQCLLCLQSVYIVILAKLEVVVFILGIWLHGEEALKEFMG